MTVRWLTAFLDVPDQRFRAGADFWLEVTAATLSPTHSTHDEFATLVPADGDAYLRVQRVADPHGGCHLDLHVDDRPATARHAEVLGAVRRDGAGRRGRHAFAGGAGRSASWTTPASRSWPARAPRSTASRSIVDDALRGHPARRLRARDHVLGRPHRLGAPGCRLSRALLDLASAGGHAAATPPATSPRGGARSSPAGAHLDLATTDPEALAAAHGRRGARVHRRHDRWITMTDPSGLSYCLVRLRSRDREAHVTFPDLAAARPGSGRGGRRGCCSQIIGSVGRSTTKLPIDGGHVAAEAGAEPARRRGASMSCRLASWRRHGHGAPLVRISFLVEN